MGTIDPQHAVGSAKWLLATTFLALAAWNMTPHGLPVGGDASDQRIERILRTVLLTVSAMAVSVAVLGAFGLLGAPGLLIFALLAWALSTRARCDLDGTGLSPGDLRSVLGTWWPLIAACGVLLVDLAVYLPVPPTNWDAMTYHLYLPARWIQEGRIFHVPTVFADAHAAYAPQNGGLVFAWQMALAGFDAVCNVVQALLLPFAALVLFRLAGELFPHSSPTSKTASAGAAALFVLLQPVRAWALTANVDVFLAVFWLAAVYWAVRSFRRCEMSSTLASALATGLVVGTKWAGVLLAVVPVSILIAGVVRHRWWRAGAIGVGLGILGGGWWYLRNWIFYGNPIFPLDFNFLGFHFEGAFRSSAMSHSFLRLGLDRWLRGVAETFGLVTCAVALVGVLGLLFVASSPHRVPRGQRRIAVATVLFVAAWTYYCAAILPYNSQLRFLIPALAVCAIGWVPVFRWLRQRWHGTTAVVWIGLAGALVLLPPGLDIWHRPLAILAQADRSLVPWLVLALLAGSIGAGWWCLRARSRLAWAVPGVLALAVVSLASSVADGVRPGFLAAADYRFQSLGILPLQDPEWAPMTLAYSGTNVPYALMGPGFRHRVIYVDTGGEAGDEFYDFWRRAREQGQGLYSTHKPGIYRHAEDQPGPWLERLLAEGVEAVAVFRLLDLERPAHWPLFDDFPIERQWMRDRPRDFRPLLVSDWAEIYVFCPAATNLRHSSPYRRYP